MLQRTECSYVRDQGLMRRTALDSVGSGYTAVVTNALAAANDDGADVCYTPSRRRILRGGPGSAYQPRHARSIRPGPPTRLCRRYGRTSPSAQTEGRGRTRARVRQLEDVRNDVRRTDGRPAGRTHALPPPRIAGSSRHRMRKSKWPAEGHSERLQRCAAAVGYATPSCRRARTALVRSLLISHPPRAYTKAACRQIGRQAGKAG